MHTSMSLNNGVPHNPKGVWSELSKCSYFFCGEHLVNYLRGCYKGATVVVCKLAEKDGNADLYINIPPNLSCNHFFKTQQTSSIMSTSDSHLTYHGRKKGKKETGEVHVVVDRSNILKGRSNILEAPLAYSTDLTIFPIPICRFEFSESVHSITPRLATSNYFELSGPLCFFNTLDIYLARKDFMAGLLNSRARIPNIVASIFAHTTLETIKTGRLVRRRGRFPQVLILQTQHYEVIVFAVQEAQHLAYKESSLSYFHCRNYIKVLFNRLAQEYGNGYFIDLLESELSKKPGFFKIQDLLREYA